MRGRIISSMPLTQISTQQRQLLRKKKNYYIDNEVVLSDGCSPSYDSGECNMNLSNLYALFYIHRLVFFYWFYKFGIFFYIQHVSEIIINIEIMFFIVYCIFNLFYFNIKIFFFYYIFILINKTYIYIWIITYLSLSNITEWIFNNVKENNSNAKYLETCDATYCKRTG